MKPGHLHVILEGHRVPLVDARENYALAKLMIDACKVSTISPVARAAIQRLQVEAAGKVGRMHLKKFSALSPDATRLYVPLHSGELLQITADAIATVPNGENQDHYWVEHPGGEPLQYSMVDLKVELANFERLLVDTQAYSVPSMRWLLAMCAALFPYVRDSCAARFLLELIGKTQQGKTSGSQRHTLLHGLGSVKGDYSIAALAALGDFGLLVLDNKEHANFTQE
jgi:hypothetical protein